MKSTQEIEYEWYLTHSGEVSSAPLGQHQEAVWADAGASSEWEWLKTLTGVTSNYLGDMWREAVAGLSLTPGATEGENRRIFFTNYTP